MALALRIGRAVLLRQPVLDVHSDLRRQVAAGRSPLLGWLSFCHLGARVSVSVLVLLRLVGAILELRCSGVVGRSGYGSHGAWACGGWAVCLLLNGCGGWVGGVAYYLSRHEWPTSDQTFETLSSL